MLTTAPSTGPLAVGPARPSEATYIAIVMSSILLIFIVQIPTVIVLGTIACGAFAYAANLRHGITRKQLYGMAAVPVVLLPAFFKPYHGLSPIFYTFSTVFVFLAAQAIAKKNPVDLLKAFQIIYGASLAAIAFILYAYWGHPEPFGEVIEGSSTNGIPAYLIIIQIGLSLCFYVVRRRLPLWPPLATAVVAFFGNGRGSLVVAGLMIVGTFLFNALISDSARTGTRRRYYFVAALALFFVFSEYGEDMVDFVTRYTKLSVGLVDTNRIEIFDDYWDKLGPVTALVGADYEGTVIEMDHNNNPHISYIRTHSYFGLPATILALVSPAIVLFGRKTRMARAVFFFFIGMAALRAYSEPILFPTLLDFFYFCYFFIFFNHAPDAFRRRAS